MVVGHGIPLTNVGLLTPLRCVGFNHQLDAISVGLVIRIQNGMNDSTHTL